MGLAFPPVRVADGWQASAGGRSTPRRPPAPPGNPTNAITGTQSDEREGSKLGERTRAMRRGKTERESGYRKRSVTAPPSPLSAGRSGRGRTVPASFGVFLGPVDYGRIAEGRVSAPERNLPSARRRW